MTMTPFGCDDFAGHLADHLEGEANAATRAAMDAHASGCADCGALLVDLAAIRSEAAALPMLQPSRDLWSGIAERIETPVVALSSGVGRRATAVTASRAERRRWWAHPALIAAGLVGITAGVTHYVTRKTMDDAMPPARIASEGTTSVIRDTVVVQVPVQVAAGGSPAGSTTEPITAGVASSPMAAPPTARGEISSPAGRSTAGTRPAASFASTAGGVRQSDEAFRSGELAALDSLYHREILRLRQIIGERRTQLDSTTVSVLERNMTVIDRAIAECRAALAADPASRFLNQQLNEALESKIELMRTAATMPVGS